MKRVTFLLSALSIVASGCSQLSFMRERGPALTPGITILATHHCTGRALLYRDGVGMIGEIVGREPVSIELLSTISGEKEIFLTLRSLDDEGNEVWEFREKFHVHSGSGVTGVWALGESACSRPFSFPKC